MPLRIFIVEDNVETLKSLTALFERRGHTVQGATLVEETLARLIPAECDLLLCDIGLPDGDGWELMRRLRKNPPRYAVAMSGYGTPADVAHSQSVGFQSHLVKPFAHAQLDEILAGAQAAKDEAGASGNE